MPGSPFARALTIALTLALSLSACKSLELEDPSAVSASPLSSGARFPDQKSFFFGLATAPAHIEDGLEDTWLDFARDKGGVVAWKNQVRPEQRLNFWSNPDVEINLAADTGVSMFRMGVDWGRLVKSPGADLDRAAMDHYKGIIDKVRAKKMRVMMTLFHHSLPKWALAQGGWVNPAVRDAFVDFSKKVVLELKDRVDYWVPFNEPAVFAALVHSAGIWPGG